MGTRKNTGEPVQQMQNNNNQNQLFGNDKMSIQKLTIQCSYGHILKNLITNLIKFQLLTLNHVKTST